MWRPKLAKTNKRRRSSRRQQKNFATQTRCFSCLGGINTLAKAHPAASTASYRKRKLPIDPPYLPAKVPKCSWITPARHTAVDWPRPRLVPGVEGESQACTRTSSSVAKVLPGAYLEKSCVELGNCLRTPCLETTTKPSGFLATTEGVIVMTNTKVVKGTASALRPMKSLLDTMVIADVCWGGK